MVVHDYIGNQPVAGRVEVLNGCCDYGSLGGFQGRICFMDAPGDKVSDMICSPVG